MTAYFRDRVELIHKLKGTAKLFAVAETLCFPVSLLTVFAVGLQAVVTLAAPIFLCINVDLPVFVIPDGIALVLVAAAVGYLTNYIAIQMLYYPVATDDVINEAPSVSDERRVELALRRSRVISMATLGFWTRGLIPRNREKVAWQIGLVAEEKFVTPEAAAKILPKITKALLSKNDKGKVRGVEMLRQLVVANRDAAAALVRDLCVGFLKNGDKSALRQFVAKIGRSEAVSAALTNALLEYLRTNPDQVVSAVRGIVSEFTQNWAKPSNEREDSLFGISQVLRGFTSAVIDGVAEIGLPQIKNLILRYAADPDRKKSVQEKLAGFLPIIFDQLGDKITERPEILDAAISGDVIERLVNVKFDDEAFWNGLGDTLAPRLEIAINDVLKDIPKDKFATFFGSGHLVAENVKDTIMRMPLLDFYLMLDNVMAEHLGAIQVFGFILGGMIGYIQYAVLFTQTGRAIVAYYMIGVPLLFVLLVKIVVKFRLRCTTPRFAISQGD